MASATTTVGSRRQFLCDNDDFYNLGLGILGFFFAGMWIWDFGEDFANGT
jgi:hypothetical protein